ncbi:MAG: 50S ribosomal protein L35 [Thermoflexibacteraceae bacterium]|jgi:large subunit ribosomal protein L35
MPKVKTKSSAKKRFSVTASGKIKHKKAFKNHILTKKSKDRKNRLGQMGYVCKADMGRVKEMLAL